MKPGVFLKLLNKKFKVLFSNQIFFKSEGLIIESQGTKDTIIREGIPPVQVKVTNWFDNIWLYIKVEFKYVEEKRDYVPMLSLSFFQEIEAQLEPLFRAEWDNFKLVEGYNHPQPHWHLNTMNPAVRSFTDLMKEDADLEMGSFASLLQEHTERYLDVYKMHFAMSGLWHENGQMVNSDVEDKRIVDWLAYTLIHVQEEIKYARA
ncbi:hypothetical protein [Prevotella nigrescens]|uniref:hypothetical protein n=1 Tax=Prevotella nigrescens TaxID=28133 RepID=UPI0036131728